MKTASSSPKPHSKPGIRWINAAALALGAALGLLVVVSRTIDLAQTLPNAERIFADEGPRAWREDFLQDYVSARAWRDGADPVAPTVQLTERYLGPSWLTYSNATEGQQNPHTPIHLALVLPLSFLEYPMARIAWLLVEALLFVLSGFFVARALRITRMRAAAVGLTVLAIPVVQKDLMFGQSNAITLLLLIGTWLSLRRGRDIAAGAALGVAVAFRLYPIFLVIALAKLGRRRAIAMQLGVAAILTGVGLFVYGGIPASENFALWRASPWNLSLIAIPYRWFASSQWRSAAVIDAAAIIPVIVVAFMLLCVVLAWRSVRRDDADSLWNAIPWMLLAAPLCWEHYTAILVPLLLLIVIQRRDLPPVPAMLGFALAFIGLPQSLIGPQTLVSEPEYLLLYGLPRYGLILLALTPWLTRRAPWLAGPTPVASRRVQHNASI